MTQRTQLYETHTTQYSQTELYETYTTQKTENWKLKIKHIF